MDPEQLLALSFLESHPHEAALALERMSLDDAAALLGDVPPGTAATVVQRIVPPLAADCLAQLGPQAAAGIVGALPVDFSAGVLRRMEPPVRHALVAALGPEEAEPIRRLLDYPEGTAGSLMDPTVLALPDDIVVAEARLRIRRASRHLIYYLYVVDRDRRLVGILDVRELLLARPHDPLRLVIHEKVPRLSARAGRDAILAHPGWRELHALPVVDDRGVLLGALRYQTLRRLEEDATMGSREQPGVVTAAALGELFRIGMAGLLGGIASAVGREPGSAPPGRPRPKEDDHAG